MWDLVGLSLIFLLGCVLGGLSAWRWRDRDALQKERAIEGEMEERFQERLRGIETVWTKKLDQSNANLEAELEAASSKLEATRRTVHMRDAELGELRKRFEDTSAKLEAASNKLADTTALAEGLTGERNTLQHNLSNVESRLSEVTHEGESSREELDRTSKELEGTVARVRELEPLVGKLEERESRIQELKDSHSSLLAARDSEIELLRARVEELEPLQPRVTEYEARIRELEPLPARLEDKERELEERELVLRGASKEHLRVVKQKDTEFDRLYKKYEKLVPLTGELKEQKQQFQALVRQHAAEVKSKDAEIGDLLAQLEQLEDRLGARLEAS